MERLTFNIWYWPTVLVTAFCYVMGGNTLSEDMAAMWGLLSLMGCVAIIALLWDRLSQTKISKWLSLLALLPFGIIVMGIIAGVAKKEEAQ